MKLKETFVERSARLLAESFNELDASRRAELRQLFQTLATEYQIRGIYIGVITAGVLLWLIGLISGT